MSHQHTYTLPDHTRAEYQTIAEGYDTLNIPYAPAELTKEGDASDDFVLVCSVMWRAGWFDFVYDPENPSFTFDKPSAEMALYNLGNIAAQRFRDAQGDA